MAGGYIRKRKRKEGPAYEAVLYLGADSSTGKYRQQAKSFRTKREAQAALAAWQVEIDRGTFVEKSQKTVADLLTYWLETYARHNVRDTTLDQYSNTINVHLIPALGTIHLQKLTPAQLQQFYSDKLSAGCRPRVVQLCHRRMRQALAMAVRLGLVTRNVAEAVDPPRVPGREMKTWTAEQARQFLGKAKESGYEPIWTVLLTTGMRRGEALGLRWKDVDWDHGVLYVRQSVTAVRGKSVFHQPKSRSAIRSVPVPAAVMEALRDHRRRQNERRLALGKIWQDHDLVFASEVGTPIGARNLDRDFRKWVARSGVPQIRIHDIRHTVITLAIGAGFDVKTLSEHVGHAQTSITMDIYAHVLPHKRREIAEGIGDLVLGPQASDPRAPGTEVADPAVSGPQ